MIQQTAAPEVVVWKKARAKKDISTQTSLGKQCVRAREREREGEGKAVRGSVYAYM